MFFYSIFCLFIELYNKIPRKEDLNEEVRFRRVISLVSGICNRARQMAP
jgi:hypothetical protein